MAVQMFMNPPFSRIPLSCLISEFWGQCPVNQFDMGLNGLTNNGLGFQGPAVEPLRQICDVSHLLPRKPAC